MWTFVIVVVVEIGIHNVYGGWTSWSQMGACSVTCGTGVMWQKRACIGDTPNPVCPGPQQRSNRCQKLVCPVNDCNCGCDLMEEHGTIRSVSPSDNSLECTWTIRTTLNRKIRLTVTNFHPNYGKLKIAGGSKIYRTVSTRGTYPFTIVARERVLNISLQYNDVVKNGNGDGAKLEASYQIVGLIPEITSNGHVNDNYDESKKSSSVNVPTVVGISTCIIIIVLVLCLVVYRKIFSQAKSKENNATDASDADENCAASLSSASIRQNTDLVKDQRESSQKQNSQSDKNSTISADQQRLIANQNNIYVRVNPTSGPMFTSLQMGHVGQLGQLAPMGQMGYGGHYAPEGHVFLPNPSIVGTQPTIACYPPR